MNGLELVDGHMPLFVHRFAKEYAHMLVGCLASQLNLTLFLLDANRRGAIYFSKRSRILVRDGLPS